MYGSSSGPVTDIRWNVNQTQHFSDCVRSVSEFLIADKSCTVRKAVLWIWCSSRPVLLFPRSSSCNDSHLTGNQSETLRDSCFCLQNSLIIYFWRLQLPQNITLQPCCCCQLRWSIGPIKKLLVSLNHLEPGFKHTRSPLKNAKLLDEGAARSALVKLRPRSGAVGRCSSCCIFHCSSATRTD